MAQVYSPPGYDQRLLSDDDRSTSTSWMRLRPEPYYSNKDITILHFVVIAAQKQFDSSPSPKPLPAAVLFKAYDDVLPNYGIDPDSDHHLSALVFRISGEHGEGSLIDKFQTILKRMGILLEFDEITTSSVPSQRSENPSLRNTSHNRLESTTVPDHRVVENAYSSRAQHTGLPVVGTRNQHTEAKTDHNLLHSTSLSESILKKDADLYLNKAPRATRTVSLRASPAPSLKDWPAAVDDIDHPPIHEPAQFSADGKWKNTTISQIAPRSDLFGNTRQLVQREIEEADNEDNTRRSETHLVQGQILSSDKSDGFSAVPTLQRDMINSISARARQIFLASKVFNRWADQTALKLEREAIARRHMIRFRCFTGWIRAPESRFPIAHQLKAVSAVQKLRRAIACQEEQLRFASSIICDHHQLGRARKVFAAWNCFILNKCANMKLWKQKRTNTAEYLLRFATREGLASRRAESHFRKSREHHARASWLAQTETTKSQSTLAKQMITTHRVQRCLAKWWDSAETKRRAMACSHVLDRAKACNVFEVWNLRARAQAFRWRNEYDSAVHAVQDWSKSTQKHEKGRLDASAYVKRQCANLVFDRLTTVRNEFLSLQHQAVRSRFFLHATRMLQVFERASTHRKHRIKQLVRRYLRMRYTQVSSKRRRRGFYDAISRWQSRISNESQLSSLADKYGASAELDRGLAAIAYWRNQTEHASECGLLAEMSIKCHWAKNWEQRSLGLGRLNVEASEFWATQNQKQQLKTWAISTLQRSGQAHTANMVRHRHGRDRRQKALQRWRLAVYGPDVSNNNSSETTLLTSAKNLSSIRMSRSWTQRTYPGSLENRIQLETPTRSTGISLPITSAPQLRLMAPVEETDVESRDSSEAEGDAAQWHPHLPRHKPLSAITELPSTTPRAPVPTYLQRDFSARRLKSSVRRMANAQVGDVQSSRLERGQNNSYSMTPGSTPAPTKQASTLSPLQAPGATGKNFASLDRLESAPHPLARSFTLGAKEVQTVPNAFDLTPLFSRHTPGKSQR